MPTAFRSHYVECRTVDAATHKYIYILLGFMKNAPLRVIFLKNAFANVVGGIGAAVFNLLLPALVARYLGKLEFSVWNLALQVVIYLQIFGFGLQNAVTRFFAHGHELNDLQDQKKTVKAGLYLAGMFSCMALVAVAVLIIFYPIIFSDIPPAMVGEFRICIALLGLSAAWQLVALVPSGVFWGLQKNIVPVGAQLLVRIMSIVMIFVVLQQWPSLMWLSLTFAICGALVVPLNFLAMARWATGLVKQALPLDMGRFRELRAYCASMAVWNIAMLLVSGLATMMVGYFDFQRVASYSLALTLITIMIGLQQALMSPLISAGAKLNARAETRAELPPLLIKATRICFAGLLVSIVLIKFFGDWFLKIWLGSGYSDDILSLLLVLAVANMIRNTAVPYAMLLMALNMQKQVQVTVFIEGAITLIASVVFAYQYGALGVAYGALVGAVAGLASNFLINFKRTRILVPDIKAYGLRSGAFLLIPVSVTILLLR